MSDGSTKERKAKRLGFTAAATIVATFGVVFGVCSVLIGFVFALDGEQEFAPL